MLKNKVTCKFLGSIFLIATTSACTITGKPISKADSTPLKISAGTANLFITTNKIQDQNQYLDERELQTLLATVAMSDQQTNKKALATLLINESDKSCYEYLTTLTTVERTTRSLFGASSEILSAAGALVSPRSTANILSGISGATQGIEGELSNSVLGGQDGDILVQAVKKGRGRQRQKLRESFITSGQTFDFNHFLIEFPTYHSSCGINYGRQVLRGELLSETQGNLPNSEVRIP